MRSHCSVVARILILLLLCAAPVGFGATGLAQTVHAAGGSLRAAGAPRMAQIAPDVPPGLAAGRYGAVLKSTNNQVFLAEQSGMNSSTQQATSTQGVAQ